MQKSLGMLELISIPTGIEAGDMMLKTASVDLVAAQSICAGKYIVIVTGEVSAVNASIKAGKQSAGMKLIDSLVIPNVDRQVPIAINACTAVSNIQALGAMETYSLCAAVLAADTAVKAAEIELIEIRLGRGLGGKSFITMTGDIAAVREAVATAAARQEVQGLMSDSVVIPAPHLEIVKSLL